MSNQYDVRAVSLDLDGCGFPKNKLPEQPDLLAAYLKTQEGKDSVINLAPYLSHQPPLIFSVNTGRSWEASYPVVREMLGDGLIMAVEHGHAIRMPGEDRPMGMDKIDKRYEAQMRVLAEIRDMIRKDPDIAAHEIHKDYFVAVRVPKDLDQEEFWRMVSGRLSSEHRDMFRRKEGGIGVFYSHGAIDIRANDLSKETALGVISEKVGIPLNKWLAVEDTDADLLVKPYNRQSKNLGYAGCPADASEKVKDAVWEGYMLGRIMQHVREVDPTIPHHERMRRSTGHIASQENGRGTLEILKHFLGD